MRLSLRRLSQLVHFHNANKWPQGLKSEMASSCSVTPSFISTAEEAELLREIEPHMKRLRYESSHWDDAIHKYREREQRRWSPANEAVIARIREASFPGEAAHLSYVHLLDLHQEGKIKPHIDSVRYCGDVITGVSLLSECVMRLRHKDDKDILVVDLMLPRLSLYKLSGIGRYDFTHEVLGDEESEFCGKKVVRGRRISVICRDLPKKKDSFQEGEIKMQPIPEG